ncbi:MAG TPA: hypothetical protein VK646_11935 [Actinomycetota bacterium]|nr:hypothetical protein [Actinomycetota bacterium]
MDKSQLRYPGIYAAVGGIVALLGVYAGWFTANYPDGSSARVPATVIAAGQLALWASVATFAFGAAYVIFGDEKIRKAMGSLVVICSMILLVACIFGFLRFRVAVQDAYVNHQIPNAAAVNPGRSLGLFVSMAGAIFALAGGAATLRPGGYVGEPEHVSPEGPPRMAN